MSLPPYEQQNDNLPQKGYIRFQTLDEAQYWAKKLAQLTPDPISTHFGLWEIFLNSIKHGIQKKLPSENHYVHVHFDVNDTVISFDIKDDGDGFDWHPFLMIDPARLTDKSGRGIALARAASFDDMHYLGNGNHVRCRIYLANIPKEF
jgi:hypothetical protein